MKDRDAIQMMQRCREEIKMLRMRVADLAPRADAYDSVKAVLGLIQPGVNQGYSEDLAWRLDKEIADLESAEPVETVTP